VTPVRRPIICLTPVRNEGWILDRFLRCAALWADHIVIADQGSDDGSAEMAAAYEKVTLVRNDAPVFDEETRQRLLIETARKIAAGAILFALDADEVLTANWMTSQEWHRVLAAPPGTVINLRRINLLPGLRSCWIPPDEIPIGYVDDGRDHYGSAIHSARVPRGPDAPRLGLDGISLLHYQYTDWERMLSKQRWYQCWERVHLPQKRAVGLYRQYHHMAAIPKEQLRDVDAAWFRAYEEAAIDMTSVSVQRPLWWDSEVLGFLAERGVDEFRRLDIWDVDWAEVARATGRSDPSTTIRDPRTVIERHIHRWLRRTQRDCSHPAVRIAQLGLRVIGW
jgi:hypothetical protein